MSRNKQGKARGSIVAFPHQLYIRRENDVNNESDYYFLAEETLDSAEDGDRVAIYEHVGTHRVNRIINLE